MKIAKITLSLLIIGILVFVSACGKTEVQKPAEQVSQKPAEKAKLSGTIKIGENHSITGPYATAQVMSINATEFAVDEVNKSGILGDAKFVLAKEDAGGTTDSAITAEQKLINQDKVLAIFGAPSTAQSLSAHSLANDAKVITFAPNASAAVPALGEYIFLSYPVHATLIPEALKKVITTRNIKTVALVTPKDYELAVTSQKTRREELAKLGVQVIIDEQTLLKDSDFTSIISKIMSKNPDMVISDGTLPHDPLLLKQLKQAGYKGSVMGGASTASLNYIATDPSFEGQLNILGWMAGAPGETEKSKKFVQDFNTRFKMMPDNFAAGIYDGMFLLAQAIAKVGNTTDMKAIRDQVASLEIDGVQGKMKYGSDRVWKYPATVVEVKGGTYIPFTK